MSLQPREMVGVVVLGLAGLAAAVPFALWFLPRQAQLADKVACEAAMEDGSPEAWAAYLRAHPDGMCAEKAARGAYPVPRSSR